MKNLNNKRIDILLVEPDSLVAEVFQKALQGKGYSVLSVASAQQAITVINKQKPKIIILELQLRLHNGIELLNEIRSYPDTSEIPVILLTYVPEQDILPFIRGKQYKVEKYLYKPQTTIEKLLKYVNEVMVP